MHSGLLAVAAGICLLTLAMSVSVTMAKDGPTTRPSAMPGWPAGVRQIDYPCDADDSQQPALWYAPAEQKKPAPLLVALHTWSSNYRQGTGKPYAKWCVAKGWVFIHPHFRGPNWTPQATGSELVVKDILSAVAYARKTAKVDPKPIYLVGASGGGYTALLMAGRAPKIWAGVSAWVAITDLTAWYHECKRAGHGYFKHIVKSCGGAPGASEKVDAEYRQRSPLTHLAAAKDVCLDINAGIRDGHGSASVPISHSINAYNLLAAKADRIADADAKHLVEKAEVPAHLVEEIKDPTYGRGKPLLRRTSGRTRLTIFNGGHAIHYAAALKWLEKQSKQGKPEEHESPE